MTAPPWWWMMRRDLEARLVKGGQTYGDRSFDLTPGRILGEVTDELIDVPGWLFVLWRSLQPKRWKRSESAIRAFCDVVGARIEAGTFSPEQMETRNDVLREIERLAAVGCVACARMRDRSMDLVVAIGQTLPRRIVEQITDDAQRGQRGGVRE